MSLNPLSSAAQALVAQRIEVKYLIREVHAQEIIDYITTYMDPDPQGRIYPVTSLYLDNAALRMYWSSCMGETNRYKLRLRSYSNDESPQLFAEVKRRTNRVIQKSRVAIRSECVEALLAGSGITHDMLIPPIATRGLNDLHYFYSMMSSFQAKPCATVRYNREAYVGRNGESIRITFDRDLSCLPSLNYSHDLWGPQAFWHDLHGMPVIMEVKFTDQYPQWVQRMIQRFGLARSSMAKYVECINSLDREGVPFTPMNEESSV